MNPPVDTPTKRVLPDRERRPSVAKRQVLSPVLKSPNSSTTTAAPPVTRAAAAQAAAAETPAKKARKPYTKRVSIVHVPSPIRSTSTPTSAQEEILPTKLYSSRPLPTTSIRQEEKLSNKDYQSILDSAIVAASLYRSRSQWLCEGLFKKYWTKPVRKRNAMEAPPNNPDVRSMQKLGSASIVVEPHSFDAMLYVVRESAAVPVSTPAPIPTSMAKPPVQVPQTIKTEPNAAPSTISSSTPTVSKSVQQPNSSTPQFKQETNLAGKPAVPTPQQKPASPAPQAKTTDPVIQMLASRAASDPHLKELMKVVATSRASQDQLREFQAHIDEFNAIVKRQEADRLARERIKKEAEARATAAAQAQRQYPIQQNANPLQSQSPFNPSVMAYKPSYTTTTPQAEMPIKHIIVEFLSPASATQPASADRWILPTQRIVEVLPGGLQVKCSFLVERKGSEVLSSLKDLTEEERQQANRQWAMDTTYYEPVTINIRAPHYRTIETLLKSTRLQSEVGKYMQDVMASGTRAPREYLVTRLPRDKPDPSAVDFTDSGIELDGKEDDELQDFYPL